MDYRRQDKCTDSKILLLRIELWNSNFDNEKTNHLPSEPTFIHTLELSFHPPDKEPQQISAHLSRNIGIYHEAVHDEAQAARTSNQPSITAVKSSMFTGGGRGKLIRQHEAQLLPHVSKNKLRARLVLPFLIQQWVRRAEART